MKNKKFYELSLEERLDWLSKGSGLSRESLNALSGREGLTPENADHMIENVVGTYALPIAVAQNFLVNGRDVLVPMVIEVLLLRLMRPR
jgi:hydroxymethylglutaryl-CoA reductase